MLCTDYGGGGTGGYSFQNTYGPPRDYYYDERPEYFRPNHHIGSYPQSGPPEVLYHDHPPHLQPQHHDGGGEGQHHHHGELNIQPLLWPLAGITLLGVLSALVKTPLLLHLGSIGHRRRRRREITKYDQEIIAKAIKSLLAKVHYRILNNIAFCSSKYVKLDSRKVISDARVLQWL